MYTLQIDRKVIQLEMERLSLSKAADNNDKAAKSRLAVLDAELAKLKVSTCTALQCSVV